MRWRSHQGLSSLTFHATPKTDQCTSPTIVVNWSQMDKAHRIPHDRQMILEGSVGAVALQNVGTAWNSSIRRQLEVALDGLGAKVELARHEVTFVKHRWAIEQELCNSSTTVVD